MPTPVFAVDVVLDLLGTEGIDARDSYDATAISAPGAVIVTEQPGSAAHLSYSFRPGIQLTVYSKLGWRAARDLAWRCLDILREAAMEARSVKSGGIHHVIVTSSPARADLTGLPAQVGRVTTQLDLVVSSSQKWA